MNRIKNLGIAIFLVITLVMAAPLFNVSASPLVLGTAPSLGTAQSFAALGGSTVTNTGSSTIIGDLGVWPGSSVTGFPPGVVLAPYAIHASDAQAQLAQNDVTAAFNALSQPADSDLTGQDLGGLTLMPGVYSFSSSAGLTGSLTLDAEGDPNAVFIFTIGSTLTTGSGSVVNIINSGSACNVFWQIGSSATLGTNTSFIGNILAMQSITLNTSATIIPGRALARNGALTLDSNTIDGSACISTQPGPPTATPTITPTFSVTSTPIVGSTASPTSAATTAPTEEAVQGTTPVPGLPGTGGGAPIRDESFPWWLVIVVGISAISLMFGVRAYSRPK